MFLAALWDSRFGPDGLKQNGMYFINSKLHIQNGGQLHDFIIALNISVFFGLWLLLRENWLNLDSVNYACPDCAREMLESCSLECQKGGKKLPKIQKKAT